MSSQFSISTFTFAPGVLFCIFLDSFLFLVHLHDASTSIIRLGAFEKRRRFSFRSVAPSPTDQDKVETPNKNGQGQKETDIVGYNNGRPTSGEREVSNG
jgi:hypothetical protein